MFLFPPLWFLSAVSTKSERDQSEERGRLPPEPHQVFPRSVQVRYSAEIKNKNDIKSKSMFWS